MGQASVRGWPESRSRILNYTNHVRWSWSVGRSFDSCVRSGCHRFSFVASINLLEKQPPYQGVLLPIKYRVRRSSSIKELDSYQEARKKLSKPPVKKLEEPPKPPKAPKGKPKAKGGGKERDSPDGETA